MHGDVLRQALIQDRRHDVGCERGQVFVVLRRRPEVHEYLDLVQYESTAYRWSVQAVDSWHWQAVETTHPFGERGTERSAGWRGSSS